MEENTIALMMKWREYSMLKKSNNPLQAQKRLPLQFFVHSAEIPKSIFRFSVQVAMKMAKFSLLINFKFNFTLQLSRSLDCTLDDRLNERNPLKHTHRKKLNY